MSASESLQYHLLIFKKAREVPQAYKAYPNYSTHTTALQFRTPVAGQNETSLVSHEKRGIIWNVPLRCDLIQYT